MIDADLAQLYDVPTYRLNEAVKRNRRRFPSDFMFRLSKKEAESLTSHFAISKKGRGGRRTLPYAFTEQGVAMLSSVLSSERANGIHFVAFCRLARGDAGDYHTVDEKKLCGFRSLNPELTRQALCRRPLRGLSDLVVFAGARI